MKDVRKETPYIGGSFHLEERVLSDAYSSVRDYYYTVSGTICTCQEKKRG